MEKFFQAGYTTYHSWLNNVGHKHQVCPPGYVETYINNIGKYIIKNYRVSKDKNNTVDVITTTLHIKLDENIQTDSSLKPIAWRKGATEKEIQTKMETIIQQSKILFCKIRSQYISHMTDIYKEQKDEVEIRINQLKERRKKQCRNQNCREYIRPINERVANVTLL